MAEVTLKLIDTPTGGVAIKTDFEPAVGRSCTLAQAAALDIIARTKKSYQLDNPKEAAHDRPAP